MKNTLSAAIAAMSVVALLLAACGPSATATPVAPTATPIPKVTAVPTPPPPGNFRRGDADQNGAIELTDAVNIVWALFLSTDPPYDAVFRCLDSADTDDSGEVDINDPVFLVNWLFLAGSEIPLPGTLICGPDQTVDALPACAYNCQ